MGGRVTVMPQLFNMRNRGTQVMVLEDILDKNLGNIDLLEKAFVHRYIEEKNFLLPDQMELLRRWGPAGPLALMSAGRVFTPVRSKDDDRIKEAIEKHPMHADNIQIRSRVRTQVGREYNVSFDLWTHAPNGSTKQRKTAHLVINYASSRAQKVATPGYYFNPMGMIVTDYDDGIDDTKAVQ